MVQGPLDQNKPRRRTRIACDSCFRKKIKCYRDSVPCEWCTQQKLQCTFDRAHRNNRAASADGGVTVFSLDEPPSSGDEPMSSSHTEISQVPLGQSFFTSSINHIFGHVPINLRVSIGLPFFAAESQQWMESRTGQKIDFDRLNLPTGRTKYQGVHDLASVKEYFRHHAHPDLPERNVVLSAFHKFNSSAARRHFPFLHPDLFPYTLKAAYENDVSEISPHVPSARACVFAFVAFSNFMLEGKLVPNNIELERSVHEAQYLASEILDGEATVDGIQALLMVSICRLGQISTMNSIEPMFMTSIRFIFIMGGHLNPATQKSPSLFQVHCRTLFWIAYVMDVELCLRTCRPPAIFTDYCDLTFPSASEMATEFCIPDFQFSSTQILSLFYPTDLRLVSIQLRITKALHSPQAASKSDAELLKTIRDLDDAVDGWYKSLKLPDDLSNLPAQRILTHEEALRSSFMLHIQYKYCIVSIHQMSTRCTAWMADSSSQALGIKLSLEVAADASRALLQQYLGSKTFFQMGGFWFAIFYLLTGVMNLFCQVLKEPSHPQSENDVQLLDQISVNFFSAAELHAFPDLSGDVALIKVFVAELSRLARCATIKEKDNII